MQFINTDGMAFIGPGSEWFWTAVSGMVLAVTFIAIWRQLALQRSAAGYAQVTDLSRQEVTEPMLRVKVEILQALRDGCEPAQVPYGAASYVIDFWEDIGVPGPSRPSRPKAPARIDGQLVRRRWGATLHPFVERVRADVGPRGAEHFEWLAGQMAILDQKVGDTTIYDAEFLARTFDYYERNLSDRLRTAEELRGFVLRPANIGGQLTDAFSPIPSGAMWHRVGWTWRHWRTLCDHRVLYPEVVRGAGRSIFDDPSRPG